MRILCPFLFDGFGDLIALRVRICVLGLCRASCFGFLVCVWFVGFGFVDLYFLGFRIYCN